MGRAISAMLGRRGSSVSWDERKKSAREIPGRAASASFSTGVRPRVSPLVAVFTYNWAGRICFNQSSTETRKLATMIAIDTISVKLARTPPSAIEAWLGALANRASANTAWLGLCVCLSRKIQRKKLTPTDAA